MNEKARYLFLAPHGESYDLLREVIADALSTQGIEPVRLENGTTQIFQSVRRAIQRADFVIADLTGTDPNVMYELGYAHALRKTVLFVVQEGAERNIPSDLQENLYFAYDLSNPDNFRKYLQKWVERRVRSGALEEKQDA
jgi:hypothetical protein